MIIRHKLSRLSFSQISLQMEIDHRPQNGDYKNQDQKYKRCTRPIKTGACNVNEGPNPQDTCQYEECDGIEWIQHLTCGVG